MDQATFLATFPEFDDVSQYPAAMVAFYLNLAVLRLNPLVWEESYDYGTALYTAHCLAIARRRAIAAKRGLMPGQASGPIAGKTVKDVSITYQGLISSLEGAGNYNLTDYGTQFWELVMIKGQGCIQLGGSDCISGMITDPYFGISGFAY